MLAALALISVIYPEARLYKHPFDDNIYEFRAYPAAEAKKNAAVCPDLAKIWQEVVATFQAGNISAYGLDSVRMAACVEGRWLLVDRLGFAKLGTVYGTVDVVALEQALRKIRLSRFSYSRMITLKFENQTSSPVWVTSTNRRSSLWVAAKYTAKLPSWLTGFEVRRNLVPVGKFHLGFDTKEPDTLFAVRQIGKQFHVVLRQ